MTTETPQETIERLCERTDLGREELLSLRDAREAARVKPIATEEIRAGRWTIQITGYPNGRWYARAHTADYECERAIYRKGGDQTEAEVRQAIADFLASLDATK